MVAVHHSGNDSSGRSRGSSSIRAAMDVEFEIIKNNDDVITVYNTKMKNFEQPKPFAFNFKPVANGVVLEPTDFVPKQSNKSLSNNALKSLQCLRKAIDTDGIAPPKIIIDLFPDSPQNIPKQVITVKKWRALAYEAIPYNEEAKNPQ